MNTINKSASRAGWALHALSLFIGFRLQCSETCGGPSAKNAPSDHFPGAAGSPVSGGLRPCCTFRLQLIRRQTQAFFTQLSLERLPQADQECAILHIAIRRPRFPQRETRSDPERKSESSLFVYFRLFCRKDAKNTKKTHELPNRLLTGRPISYYNTICKIRI